MITKKDPNTLISDNTYRGEEINKIRELAIALGGQALDSPTGRRLEKVCKSVENCEVRHHLSFIAMLMALTSNTAIKSRVAQQRISEAIMILRGKNGICPMCNQMLVPRMTNDPDVSHATDTDCPQCGQPVRPRPLHCVDG